MNWQTNCTFCHGERNDDWTTDQLPKAAPATGAHKAHLTKTEFGGPVSCNACHVVPPATDEAAAVVHVDSDVSVVFSGTAVARGTAATWDGTTCSTYCHGSAAKGGVAPTLEWTDKPDLGCTSCHGYPATSHTGNTIVGLRHGASSCTKCHAGYTTVVVAERHLNGTADVYFPKQGAPGETYEHTTGWDDCNGCHQNNAQASDAFNGTLP